MCGYRLTSDLHLILYFFYEYILSRGILANFDSSHLSEREDHSSWQDQAGVSNP